MSFGRFTKRIVATISAIALVVAGIVYAPSSVKAADPATLTYTEASCEG